MSGQDEVETHRAAVEQALLHRHEPGRHQLTPAAREWRGLSLIEMARSFLEAEGIPVRGMGRDEIATRAGEAICIGRGRSHAQYCQASHRVIDRISWRDGGRSGCFAGQRVGPCHLRYGPGTGRSHHRHL